jgi:hypothetical protein
MQVALVTGQSEIFESVRASVFARENMFDVEGMKSIMFLPQTAIFTPVACAVADLIANGGTHHEVA